MKAKLPAIVGLALLCAVSIGVQVGRHLPPGTPAASAPRILYWWDPMMPDYRSDKPGKSPMGMDLVPVYEGQTVAEDKRVVTIAPEVTQNLGLRTALVERSVLVPKVESYGTIALDASRVVHVHVRRNGWVEKLHVRSAGEHVERGQLLMEVFSPDIVFSAYELAREVQRGTAEMAAIARRKLHAMGVSDEQVDEIQRTGAVPETIKVFAPRTGLIASIAVAEGMYVQPEMTMMSITDHSSVWVMSEVFESQQGLVRPGMTAEVRVTGYPGRVWVGKVNYIYPDLQPDTRTARLRISVDNADLALKENMYASVALEIARRDNVLIIPSEALIRTALGDRVVLAMGDGRFKPVTVTAGLTVDDKVEIVSGLAEGDRVVTSAQFLIDSESSMKAGLDRMGGGDGPRPATAEGTVVSLPSGDGKIVISHGPIPDLSWPPMTMSFAVGPGVTLKGVAPGDHIRFGLVPASDGTYTAIGIERLGGAGGAP